MMARQGIHVCAAISADWRRNYAAKYGQAIVDRLIEPVRWLDAQGCHWSRAPTRAFPTLRSMIPPGAWNCSSIWGSFGSGSWHRTNETAGAVGLREHTGRLAPGLDADLLVVDADPLRSIAALRAAELVVTRGRLHQVDHEGKGGTCPAPGA